MIATRSVHTYRVGEAAARDPDPRRAFLLAFGLGLKLQRVARGLSQEEFADLVGLHRTFYGQLERAQRGISISELPHIARALGVPTRSLLPEAESET